MCDIEKIITKKHMYCVNCGFSIGIGKYNAKLNPHF